MTEVIRRGAVVACLIAGLAWPAVAQEIPRQEAPKQEEKKPEEKKPDEAAAADVNGDWDMTVETQQGPMVVGLTFKVENDKLTGTVKGPQGDLAVTGTITPSEMKFGGTVNTQNGELEITFTGKPEKEKLSGTVAFGTMGTGNWSAVRPKQ